VIDRTQELELLTNLLDGAADGNSAAIVIRGDSGIGKTALLEAVSEQLTDCLHGCAPRCALPSGSPPDRRLTVSSSASVC
jgi:hypothetical protein